MNCKHNENNHDKNSNVTMNSDIDNNFTMDCKDENSPNHSAPPAFYNGDYVYDVDFIPELENAPINLWDPLMIREYLAWKFQPVYGAHCIISPSLPKVQNGRVLMQEGCHI